MHLILRIPFYPFYHFVHIIPVHASLHLLKPIDAFHYLFYYRKGINYLYIIICCLYIRITDKD